MPDILNLNSSIYNEMKDKRDDNVVLQKCVEDSVSALLDQDLGEDRMAKPVCLLGKIQSGKTRAFVGVMAMAFDRGINTIIVLTKNSKILGKQTTQRIANEFHSLDSGKSISVEYITDIDNKVVLGEAQLRQKRVVVGIKHHKNVEKINEFIINRNPGIAKQNVLIIDDEADVSAIGYRRVRENVPFDKLSEEDQDKIIRELEGEEVPDTVRIERKEMLLVADQINTMRQGIPNHRYFQVTATPASIFLQPEEIFIQTFNVDYSVEDTPKAPLLSDQTILLPIHDKYIGGEFFFGQASDPESMAQFTYRMVYEQELKFLGRRDQRHINNIFKSGNFPALTEFVDNLLLAVASYIACIVKFENSYSRTFEVDPIIILNASKNTLKGFSAMIHTSTQRKIHEYQSDLVEHYIKTCKNVVQNNPDNLRTYLKQKIKRYFEYSILPCYKLFKETDEYRDSYIKDLDQIDFEFIFECYSKVLISEHVRVFKINSDEQIEARIDHESGELKREVLANIYIGGQSLDRGITIQRLLGFFYGREPKIAQLDTTLQHARLYGARPMQDLVFTRLYCSDAVNNRLTEITEIDQVLRQSIINNHGDNRFAAIELGIRGQVRPTNPDRIMISDCINLKTHKRFLPVGFNTRIGNACERHMETIDNIITQNLPNKISGFEGEICFINWDKFSEINKAFMSGMIDEKKWDIKPLNHHWQKDQLDAFYKLIRKSYFPEDDRVILIVKRGRNQIRIKIDGKINDTPETSKTDTQQMKDIMQEHNVPGLLLFEQAGTEKIDEETRINYGWNGQRFYWPLLMLPKMKRDIMISLDAFKKGKEL